jgi:hypothetical protein
LRRIDLVTTLEIGITHPVRIDYRRKGARLSELLKYATALCFTWLVPYYEDLHLTSDCGRVRAVRALLQVKGLAHLLVGVPVVSTGHELQVLHLASDSAGEEVLRLVHHNAKGAEGLKNVRRLHLRETPHELIDLEALERRDDAPVAGLDEDGIETELVAV